MSKNLDEIDTVGNVSVRRLPSAALLLAGTVLVAVLLYAVFAPMITPQAWHEVDLAAARNGPSGAHWFGTDQSGRDLFVRIAQGLRVSLLVAVITAVCSAVVGVAVGTIAAAVGGVVDAALMRLADTMNALPHLLLGIVIVAMFRGSLVAIVIAISVTHWVSIARLVRSVSLTTRAMEYVDAAYLAGASRLQVIRRHLLPAALGQGLLGLVLLVPHAIWHESALSFLGLGVPPDQPSLGTLLEQSRGEVLLGGWWTLVIPAAVLVGVTLAIGVLVAAVRRRTALTESAVTVE